MQFKEAEIYEHNPQAIICGVDEVGRGCCWGPMAVGAVVFPASFRSTLIKDSKKLSGAGREKASEEIKSNALASEVIFISTFALESFGMTLATKMAMIQAIESCKQQLAKLDLCINFVLVDAVNLSQELKVLLPNVISISEPKFEDRSISVAGASCIAKVARDGLVEKMAHYFPGTGLVKHKGYSTKEHFLALIQMGSNFLHRKNFVNTLLRGSNKYYEKQQ